MMSDSFSVEHRGVASTAVRILLVAGLLLAIGANVNAAPAAGPDAVELLHPAGPHLLIQNAGQYGGEARFLLERGWGRIWLTDAALWLTVPDLPADRPDGAAWDQSGGMRPPGLTGRQRRPEAVARPGTAIRFTFPGATGPSSVEPLGPAMTRVSYLIGSDPNGWQRDVPVWSGVRYRDLYPGIDLVIGEDERGAVPWRLEARPGAEVGIVSLLVEGADAVTVEPGRLQLEMKGRAVDVALPAWSLADRLDSVGSLATLQPGASAFSLAPGAPRNAALDPVVGTADVAAASDLVYDKPLAGSAYETGYGIAVDGSGNAYFTGETQSPVLPTTPGAYDPTNSGVSSPSEAFVAKLNAAGNAFVYLTYLGGSGFDIGWGIAVDGGLAFVAGETTSTDFPGMTGTVVGGDAFVATLNADGTDVRYVTRLGGSLYDAAYAIAVEGLSAYVTGTTYSPDLPGSDCAGSTTGDLVVAKLDALGGLVYTTCFLSGASEAGYGIAVRGGQAYVTGETASPGRDIIVVKFNDGGTFAAGAHLYQGSADDWSNAIAVDGSNNIYITGTTMSSADFPVSAGTPGWGGGATDAVVVKLNSGLSPVFATFLGGNGEDSGYGIAVDTVQGLYVTGTTDSTDFPVTTGAFDTGHNGDTDLFVARMYLPSGPPNRVTYATYLGGAREDGAFGAATDTGGHAFVSGSKQLSPDWESTDAFAAKVKVSSPLAAPDLSIATSGTSASLTWSAVLGRTNTQVFRSSQPYFQPGDWSSALPLVQPAGTSFTDANALLAVNAYFYVVKTIDATPAASENSNRVGKITYQLVKGN